ncbi:MAG: CPBP family intramembrane metalloprotease [Microbacteriaceae bacterium]|nr:CPBP family intramembrane metalloprotease [Microbacteriaceae bacterium]
MQVFWHDTPQLEYHQLLRGARRYRWWKVLLTLLLSLIYYLTLSVLFTIPVAVVMGLTGGDLLTDLNDYLVPDTQQPLSLVLTLGSITLMIPAVWLAMLSTGLRPFARVWSVALRIRWRWIGRTIVPAIVALVVMNVVGTLVNVLAMPVNDAGGASVDAPSINMMLALWSLIIVLLLVPLQATAEEVVYRGLFMQSLGAWFGGTRGTGTFARFVRGPWLPILVPALLFGFSHIYDIWGFLAVTAMAVAAGWLAWRTGGLEAAITLHVVNNLVAFGFMAFAVGGETAQTSDGGGPGLFVGEVVGLLLYSWWVDRDFSRRDGRRTRIDTIEVLRPVQPVTQVQFAQFTQVTQVTQVDGEHQVTQVTQHTELSSQQGTDTQAQPEQIDTQPDRERPHD